MQRLDKEYRQLVKMRFLLNMEEFTTREKLEDAIANKVIDKKFIHELADDIADTLNDWKKGNKPCISATSLGRWMTDSYQAGGDITKNNLDRIAKYLLCKSWGDLLGYNIEMLEERILKEHQLVESEMMISRASNEASENPIRVGLQHLLSRNLLKGQKVEVYYGAQRRIVLKRLTEDDRFMVVSCDSKILTKDMCLTIQAFFLGVNLTGIDITLNGKEVKTFYKSGGTITSIKVINDEW